jgi:hypothetical protein
MLVLTYDRGGKLLGAPCPSPNQVSLFLPCRRGAISLAPHSPCSPVPLHCFQSTLLHWRGCMFPVCSFYRGQVVWERRFYLLDTSCDDRRCSGKKWGVEASWRWAILGIDGYIGHGGMGLWGYCRSDCAMFMSSCRIEGCAVFIRSPRWGLNCSVRPMNCISSLVCLGFEKITLRFLESRPSFISSLRLSLLYAGHSNRKCSTDSVVSLFVICEHA